MRLVGAAAMLLVLASACGSQTSSSGSAPATDEASVVFKEQVPLQVALALCAKHGVTATQIVARRHSGDDLSVGVMLEKGISSDEIVGRYRGEGWTGPVVVDELYATGDRDALEGIRTEQAVRSVALKSEILERIRKEREEKR